MNDSSLCLMVPVVDLGGGRGGGGGGGVGGSEPPSALK